MPSNNVDELSPEKGLFELTLLNAESSGSTFDDVVIEGIKNGIPPEILTRLKGIWEVTKQIAGEVVAVGKIVIKQIFDFIKNNPHITIGLALGAAVATLVGGIPLLGPLLQPTSQLIGSIYGAGIGAALQAGDTSGSLYGAAIALASAFFELFKNIINSIADYWE